MTEALRDADEDTFAELVEPYRRELHAHCYRLLGSVHDADDALQETLLRAWKGIDRFEPRAPVAAWLYRIATNVCLRMLEQAQRRPEPVDAHLEPYPDPATEGADPAVEAAVMRRFQAAWDDVDIDAIVALLAEDALMTMPPEAFRVAGATEIGAFFATVPLGGRLERIRLRPARANGQPALAAYADEA